MVGKQRSCTISVNFLRSNNFNFDFVHAVSGAPIFFQGITHRISIYKKMYVLPMEANEEELSIDSDPIFKCVLLNEKVLNDGSIEGLKITFLNGVL